MLIFYLFILVLVTLATWRLLRPPTAASPCAGTAGGRWMPSGGRAAACALCGGCYQIVNNWMICEIREIRNCCGVKIRVPRSRPVWVMFSVAGFIILVILPNGEITRKSSLQSASASSGATDAHLCSGARCGTRKHRETVTGRWKRRLRTPDAIRKHPAGDPGVGSGDKERGG